ncbi:MAG TPA: MBL fold metallo-hydrolase [Methylibium sp.]|nr:MBL fold metallo-hydrolase [Methylibium sp.]
MPLPADLTVLERGWLSSNNLLVHAPDGASAVLVDSGHVVHAEQTVALVRRALRGARLERLLNTHLHSDHCGGNAALAAAFAPLPVAIPPGGYAAVRRWDEDALSFRDTGQRCARFAARERLRPGTSVTLGGRPWDVLAAPGHDPDAVMLFDARHGVLVSGDALWANGFGVVFPELDGAPAFDQVDAVLGLIEGLPVAWVLPGHGAPFDDIGAALARARSRLASWRAAPRKHLRHGAKVLLKYHVMEERAQPLGDLWAWAAATPMWQRLHAREGRYESADVPGWCRLLLDELVAAGVLRVEGGLVLDVAPATAG